MLTGSSEKDGELSAPQVLLVCRPASGKWSVGVQRKRWNDLAMSNLKKCGLLTDWRGGTGQGCMERCSEDDYRKIE